jgi:acyl dehydratase
MFRGWIAESEAPVARTQDEGAAGACVEDEDAASGASGRRDATMTSAGDHEMAGSRPVMGRWFEDLTPGTVIDHAVTRTITEADNTLFSVLTMNAQPLHLDESFAEDTEFGTRLVNSLFTLSLLIGLSVFETTLGTTVANLGFEEIAFPTPVIPGDSIHAQTEVVSARPSSSRPTQGVVVFEHRAYNQRDELVARCRRSALMHRRPT